MANVAHSTLTGSDLHEPKGITSAALGTVYVSNGSGSGTWNDVGTAAFTGMIADFMSPVAPAGWLELGGQTISTSTYASLYGVMTIQHSGTRTNGSPVITSLPDTSAYRVGYYVFGTGIASGTTIVSINSGTQITLSNNASSPGTSVLAISPWLLGTGTMQLPNTISGGSGGLYRRSRSNSTIIGAIQGSQNLAHTHAVNGTTSLNSADHTHGVNYAGTTGGMNANNPHQHAEVTATNVGNTGGGGPFGNFPGSALTGATNIDHGHAFTVNTTTTGISANHSHNVNLTSASEGGAENRPPSLIVMTCVKT